MDKTPGCFGNLKGVGSEVERRRSGVGCPTWPRASGPVLRWLQRLVGPPPAPPAPVVAYSAPQEIHALTIGRQGPASGGGKACPWLLEVDDLPAVLTDQMVRDQ